MPIVFPIGSQFVSCALLQRMMRVCVFRLPHFHPLYPAKKAKKSNKRQILTRVTGSVCGKRQHTLVFRTNCSYFALPTVPVAEDRNFTSSSLAGGCMHDHCRSLHPLNISPFSLFIASPSPPQSVSYYLAISGTACVFSSLIFYFVFSFFLPEQPTADTCHTRTIWIHTRALTGDCWQIFNRYTLASAKAFATNCGSRVRKGKCRRSVVRQYVHIVGNDSSSKRVQLYNQIKRDFFDETIHDRENIAIS